MLKQVRKLLLTGALLCASWVPVAAWALPYSNLYVFGDSLSDSGNNAIFLDTFVAPPPGTLRTDVPFSGPFVPDFPYAVSGRYSNGPVWAEQFAGSLGLSALPSLAGGTNYAFGGATTGPSGSSFPFSLRDQVSSYLGKVGGVASASALYVVEGGGNDARDALDIARLGGDPTSLITGYAANIATIISQLKTAGAHDILLWNIPDIGKTPSVQAFGPTASAAATGIVMAMNMALELTLAGLPPTFLDGLHIFDAFTAFQDIVDSPAAFDFTNVTDACGADPACIADPTGYFFWDGIHPTTAGHALIASEALAAIPEPESLLLVGISLIALVTTRHRRG